MAGKPNQIKISAYSEISDSVLFSRDSDRNRYTGVRTASGLLYPPKGASLSIGAASAWFSQSK
jgi:hypothetical protein